MSRDESSSVPSVSSVFSTRCTGPAPTTSTVPPTVHRVEWLCVGPKAATRQPVLHSVHNADGVPSDEGSGAARPSCPLPSTTGRTGANRIHRPQPDQQPGNYPAGRGPGRVVRGEVRPSRSHELSKSIDSERIFYPSDDSLLPGPWQDPGRQVVTERRRRVFGQSSVVTWGDWSREWSSHRSDEAHVTTPGVPIIGLGRAVPV